MSFIHVDVPQRSAEWHQARCGRLTGSRAADMLATIKSGEAAARRDLRALLVAERLTNQPQGSDYINAEMQRGIDKEPEAIEAYEALTGKLTRTTGFIAHDTLMAGCSLDAHVGDFEVIVSVKCPKTATHLRYLQTGRMPSEYVPQMLHELWMVPSATAYDFISFDDRLPEHLRVFHVRTLRSEIGRVAQMQLELYEDKAKAFLSEVDRMVESLQTVTNLTATLKAVAGSAA